MFTANPLKDNKKERNREAFIKIQDTHTYNSRLQNGNATAKQGYKPNTWNITAQRRGRDPDPHGEPRRANQRNAEIYKSPPLKEGWVVGTLNPKAFAQGGWGGHTCDA